MSRVLVIDNDLVWQNATLLSFDADGVMKKRYKINPPMSSTVVKCDIVDSLLLPIDAYGVIKALKWFRLRNL